MRLPFDGAGLSCVRYRCLCEAHIRGRDLGPRATEAAVWRVALVALDDRAARVIGAAVLDDARLQRGEMVAVEGLGASVGRTISRSGTRFYATTIRPLKPAADAGRVCAGAGTCPSCAQRRKHAGRLTTQHGLSYEEAAQRIGLTPQQVSLLADMERDRLHLKQYKLAMNPTERVRGVRQTGDGTRSRAHEPNSLVAWACGRSTWIDKVDERLGPLACPTHGTTHSPAGGARFTPRPRPVPGHRGARRCREATTPGHLR
jgi:hypothetical protein